LKVGIELEPSVIHEDGALRTVDVLLAAAPNRVFEASTVRQFLTSAGLPTKWFNQTEQKTTKELAQIAKNQTVMVVCNP